MYKFCKILASVSESLLSLCHFIFMGKYWLSSSFSLLLCNTKTRIDYWWWWVNKVGNLLGDKLQKGTLLQWQVVPPALQSLSHTVWVPYYTLYQSLCMYHEAFHSVSCIGIVCWFYFSSLNCDSKLNRKQTCDNWKKCMQKSHLTSACRCRNKNGKGCACW